MSEREERTIDYYNSNAKEFQESIRTANMNEACDQFLSYFTKEAYILDLGCGTGRDSRYFRSFGHSVLPIDPDCIHYTSDNKRRLPYANDRQRNEGTKGR